MYIAKTIAKVLLGLNVEFRRFVYHYYGKNKIIRVRLDQEIEVSLRCSGNIPEILYAEQRLVPYRRSFESKTLRLFKHLVKPGAVIVDVGANVGMYSLFFCNIAERAKIFSFEPNETTRNLLCDNIRVNGFNDLVEVLPYALSDSDSEAFLVCPIGNDALAFLSTDRTDNSVPIKMMMLDTFVSLNSIRHIDFIKVDIEGAELLFLKGADRTVREKRPVIVFELANRWTLRFGYIPGDVIRWLGDRDYFCIEYEHEQWIAVPSEHRDTIKVVKELFV